MLADDERENDELHNKTFEGETFDDKEFVVEVFDDMSFGYDKAFETMRSS